MKRVLHLGKFYPPVTGGMERVLQTLCLVSAGLVESQVLVTHTGREDLHEEVTIGETDGLPPATVDVTRVGTLARYGSVNVAPGFVAALRRSRADLIVLHEPNPWALLSYAIARPSAPLAIWYHSDVVRPALQYALFYAPLARFAYNRAERIVVSSPALAEQARALAPYRDRVSVIPFGINPNDVVVDAGRSRSSRADRRSDRRSVRAICRPPRPLQGRRRAAARAVARLHPRGHRRRRSRSRRVGDARVASSASRTAFASRGRCRRRGCER